jgi:hypothetical protein
MLVENLCKYRDTSGMRSSNAGIHGNTVGNAYHPLQAILLDGGGGIHHVLLE